MAAAMQTERTPPPSQTIIRAMRGDSPVAFITSKPRVAAIEYPVSNIWTPFYRLTIRDEHSLTTAASTLSSNIVLTSSN